MRIQPHRPAPAAVFIVLAAAIAMALGAGPFVATPVIGAVPQPVLPVEGPGGGGDPGPDTEPEPDEPQDPVVRICLGGSGSVARLLAYPGPVLPVEPGDESGDGDPVDPDEPADPTTPPAADCTTDLSLALVVRSAGSWQPDGVSASTAGLSVPQPALVSGYSTTLPAVSRTIGLSIPDREWQLADTSCGCTSVPTIAGRPGGLLAAYPGPVVPLGPGGIACGGAGASSEPQPVMASRTPGAFGPAILAAYPGPVLPVAPGEEPDPGDDPSPDEPPSTRPVTIGWDASGTVAISDPDRVGAVVSCTWTIELLTPREGRWRAVNGVGRIRCPGLSQRIPGGDTEVGRLQHRRGGDRLVGRGLATGRQPITVDRDPNDPRRYVGTIPLPVPQGTARFTATLNVITEEYIEGRLEATARIQGGRCQVDRPFTLTFVGD